MSVTSIASLEVGSETCQVKIEKKFAAEMSALNSVVAEDLLERLGERRRMSAKAPMIAREGRDRRAQPLGQHGAGFVRRLPPRRLATATTTRVGPHRSAATSGT
jgi:hypothetical protein